LSRKHTLGALNFCRSGYRPAPPTPSSSSVGSPGEQLLSFITISLIFRTFAPCHSPSCSGIDSLRLFIPTFGAYRVLSSKTTMMMLPRRPSQRLHPGEGPSQESTDNPPLHEPSIEIIPTITEEPKHPTFGNTPEVQLYQSTHASTIAAGPSQNSGAASSS
jgi:hypothetical protein